MLYRLSISVCTVQAQASDRSNITSLTLPESEQENWIKKINLVKKAETKVQKLMELVDFLTQKPY